VPLAPGSRVLAISSGWMHDCALIDTGSLQCAGLNYSGELGRGRSASCRNGESDGGCSGTGGPAPLVGDYKFISVTSGLSHSCALTADGEAYCWGSNTAGETGIGDRRNVVFEPTAVVGGHRFRQLSAGERHTCGVALSGEIYRWGAGSNGQLGSNPILRERRPTGSCMAVPSRLDDPRQDFIEVTSGYLHTCALTAARRTYCWGREYSKPDSTHAQKLVWVSASFPFRSLSAGYEFTCGISKAGLAYCWAAPGAGVNAIGRTLATWGCELDRGCLDETPVSKTIRFRSVAAAESHACGIAESGKVYCWGLRDVSKVGRAQTAAEQTLLCRRVKSPRCADEPFEVPVPNLTRADASGESGSKWAALSRVCPTPLRLRVS
jgi:alpha-tubulin suppressor-like RCC1 family protein